MYPKIGPCKIKNSCMRVLKNVFTSFAAIRTIHSNNVVLQLLDKRQIHTVDVQIICEPAL